MYNRIGVACLLAAVALAVVPSCLSVARADTGFEAAQVCYSEAGVANHRECAAVLESLRARALLLHRPFRVHMRLYSGEVFNRQRLDPRRWLAFLNPAGTQPEGWPARASWGARRAAWGRLVTFARAWLRAPWNPCHGPGNGASDVPQDWGVFRAVRRYRRIYPEAVTLDCNLGPGRHNVFLRRHPYSDSTDPQDTHNQPQPSPKPRATVPRITLGFGRRGACIRYRNLSDKALDTLP